jgi:hypothetical protein
MLTVYLRKDGSLWTSRAMIWKKCFVSALIDILLHSSFLGSSDACLLYFLYMFQENIQMSLHLIFQYITNTPVSLV